jgi:hypothetical protein
MEGCLLCSLASVWKNGEQQMCIINVPQTEIHFHQTTMLTPEQFIAGLTDFGPGRSRLFANSADEYLKVHYLGRSEADVTEGSGGIWERLYYDWSDPNCVVVITTDSNVWGIGSGHTYTLTRQPNGATDIDVLIAREGRNLQGWAIAFLLRTLGKGILKRKFENSVKAIEARNAAKVGNYEFESPVTNNAERFSLQVL